MANEVNALAGTIANAKRLLLVVHEYLPLPLALWMNSLVSLLKTQDKEVTVLVAQEMKGWAQRVDELYPVDMVVSLDQLRQIISIPVSHQGSEIGDVSYLVAEGNLEITVVPVKETLETDKITTRTEGKIYDVVVGVGVSARHQLLQVLQTNQASLSSATGIFVGTFAVAGALQEVLPFLAKVETIEKESDSFLRKVLEQITEGKTLLSSQRELVTLFIQSIGLSQQQFDYIDRAGYEYLAKISAGDMDSGRMSSLYGGDFAKQNRILQQILSGAQQSDNGEVLLFTVRATQLAQLQVTVQDAIIALYYLPKYPQVKQVAVVLEENLQTHHVYVTGTEDKIQQVAMKFGFSKTQKISGGIITGQSFEKVCQDVSRVLGHEFLVYQEPQVQTVPQKPVRVMSQTVSAQTAVPIEIQDSPTIPVAEKPEPHQEPIVQPSLDEVLANTVLPPEEDAEIDSGEDWDATAPQTVAPSSQESRHQSGFVPISEAVAQVAQEVVPPEKAPVAPVVRTSSGVDFAAIAKKMRESIT
ncbi:MAG: hypothetical protein QY312_03140 [Candidatus Dojkabacteria bacterium]|nr:MAG: hypothetical protein QY312_03140 [Candidatus Dojkabacteria bacterium]